MSVSMPTKMRPRRANRQGSSNTRTSPSREDIRDALELSHQRLDERYPQALDHYADGLTALAGELKGCASIVSGTLAPDKWRKMLRGERALPLAQIYRLAASDRPEARRAVRELATQLAALVGLSVTPADPIEPDLVDAISDVVAASAHAAAVTLEKLKNDGAISNDELPDVVASAREMRRSGDALEAAARAASKKTDLRAVPRIAEARRG